MEIQRAAFTDPTRRKTIQMAKTKSVNHIIIFFAFFDLTH